MIWLEYQGFLGEIECLSPTITETPLCSTQVILRQEGFPRLAILSCDNISVVQFMDDGYIIWLAKNKTVDREIVYKNLQFFFAEDELIGILAHQVVPEQDIYIH